MKTKRIMLFVLSAVMIISCFSGCGKTEVVNHDIATKAELNPKVIGDYGDLKLPIADDFPEITVIATSSST